MSIFDKWTDLDPALALKRIEIAHGSAIFDRFSYLDPQRAILQIEDALGIDLDNTAMDFGQLEDAIDAAVEDTTPEWVPEDAKIHIDLVNNRAWTEADGEVAIDALLGTDANTDDPYGPSEYLPENLSADGYLNTPGMSIALIGAARTKVLDEATLVFQYKTSETVSTVSYILFSVDGNDALEVDLQDSEGANKLHAYSWGGSAEEVVNDVINAGVDALNCGAVTTTSDRLDAAANGTMALTMALDSTDRSPGNPLAAAIIDVGQYFLQRITIYDALPDTDGLSELSETA